MALTDVVRARGLVKKYDGFTAVKGIDFAVHPRECFGFLGPNGAGKTTTIKMIHCFTPVTAGSLEVLGYDVRRQPREIKARLGVVPQEDNLDPELTVQENLLLYAGYFDIPRGEARQRVQELLAFAGLEEKAGVEVEHLSGGMKRRLAIARALVNKPQLLILDEPTTGLDPEARHLVWEKLRQLKAAGVTLILTTHYLEEAAQLCDRLVIMDRGIILEEGAPRELVQRHIGREVLELAPVDGEAGAILPLVAGSILAHQTIGQTLYLYTNNGREVWRQVQGLNSHFSHMMLRPATLEDVFLKLTGRGLD
ncbi:Daunorubicin/doxorubicin resistance ATP-binding protein DrrA [Neomoorella glycerini]|uniref:Daunorubicin/doxorubicin resistance ATP-binding protein DrrA n=1 Tax=Neomoorella glycerini TaxID=55779 RepID=A0A6I5ZTK7_9FIRM|nr:Daunorubicin/doxorubicin resistance ATP-binding protein DrrA [Moorella glycerini]